MIKIAPSILAADPLHLGEEVRRAKKARRLTGNLPDPIIRLTDLFFHLILRKIRHRGMRKGMIADIAAHIPRTLCHPDRLSPDIFTDQKEAGTDPILFQKIQNERRHSRIRAIIKSKCNGFFTHVLSETPSSKRHFHNAR